MTAQIMLRIYDRDCNAGRGVERWNNSGSLYVIAGIKGEKPLQTSELRGSWFEIIIKLLFFIGKISSMGFQVLRYFR